MPSGHYSAGGRHNYTDPGETMDCRQTYSADLLDLAVNLQVRGHRVRCTLSVCDEVLFVPSSCSLPTRDL